MLWKQKGSVCREIVIYTLAWSDSKKFVYMFISVLFNTLLLRWPSQKQKK